MLGGIGQTLMEFGGQTTKNIHNSLKVCLQTTFWALECFVKFYMFILYEIYIRGGKIVYDHIQIWKLQEKLCKGPWGRTLHLSKRLSRPAPNKWGNRRLLRWSMPCPWRSRSRHRLDILISQSQFFKKNKGPDMTAHRWPNESSIGRHRLGLETLQVTAKCGGEVVNSPRTYK